MNFLYDLKFNVIGTIFALTGVIVTSFYQVVSNQKKAVFSFEIKFILVLQLVGEKQKELQINSMQLLYYQAPISAAILILPMLVLEPVSQVIFRSWSLTEIVCIELLFDGQNRFRRRLNFL